MSNTGIGNAKFSMVLALLDGVVLRIGMICFLSGKWKKRKVLAEDI